jgi:hypothetical protein
MPTVINFNVFKCYGIIYAVGQARNHLKTVVVLVDCFNP